MNSADKEIKATIILETIGKPKEYLTETLNGMVDNIGQQKGIEVKNQDVKDPQEMEKKPGFFSTFAEVEIEAEQILNMAMILFQFMPSNIEIHEPEKLTLSNNDLNEMFNALAKRLHAYDEVSKILQNENQKMLKRLEELEPGKWAKKQDSNSQNSEEQK
ncbi:MAG: hypothetical protein ABEI74_01035 [Candidatus Pacearchaeota archaeon]